MTIWCKHVQRLKMQIFYNFCAAHSPVRLDIETKFSHFLFLTWLSIIRNREFRRYIQPDWWMCSTKIKKNCSSSLWTCLHHMVILRTQNKITDFFIILAWASPFNPAFAGNRSPSIMRHTSYVHYKMHLICKFKFRLRFSGIPLHLWMLGQNINSKNLGDMLKKYT